MTRGTARGETVRGNHTSLSAMACLGLLCDSPNDIRDLLEQLIEEKVSTKEINPIVTMGNTSIFIPLISVRFISSSHPVLCISTFAGISLPLLFLDMNIDIIQASTSHLVPDHDDTFSTQSDYH